MAGSWPQAVLFDLDGTLVDREQALAAATARVCARAGAPIDPAEAGRLAGRSWPEVHAALPVSALPGWGLHRFLAEVLAEAATAGAPHPPVPGAAALVDRLARRGLPLGLVTGASRAEATAALGELGVAGAFWVVVTADDGWPGKPAPDGYLAAAEAVGVGPAGCVVVEDSVAGVAAGRAAGMAVVATAACNPPAGHPAHQDLSGADLVVAALAELTDEALAGLAPR